ncbi:hypothetical protein TWF696_007251 [Orbilia brochopaga]|uniref:HlyIII-domain-containing protein n=1 Tax=Orbilia brochopaga TaxID=3140254 RepID=A0AAV9UTV9_9PEZI
MSGYHMLAMSMDREEQEPGQVLRHRHRQANGSANKVDAKESSDVAAACEREREEEEKYEGDDDYGDEGSVMADLVDDVAATVEKVAEQLTCVWDELRMWNSLSSVSDYVDCGPHCQDSTRKPAINHAYPLSFEYPALVIRTDGWLTSWLGMSLFCRIEDWQRDNHFIRRGYRPATASYRKSLHSLSYWHNESINIYTHLLGAIFFTLGSYVLYTILAPRYPTASAADIYAFLSFFAGCFVCLGLSATYHTVCNHSAVAARWWNVMDYVGIVGLITGSFVGSVFYGFRCEAAIRDGYFFMICTIAVACATISIHPHFRTPKYRSTRTAMFVAMGLSGVLPLLHGMQLRGLAEASRRCGMPWLLAEGVSYIIGAGMYAARVPERWQPGRFDIVGASHQIFHVLVLVGAMCHLAGLVAAFDYAHAGGVGAGC